MNRYNQLFLKIGFIIFSSILIWLWLFLSTENNILSFILRVFIALIIGRVLRRLYLKLFENDVVSQYGYLFILLPLIFWAFIFERDKNIERKETIIANRFFVKNRINDMLDTCNYYEAKLYGNNLLFKIKQDSNEYLASDSIKSYAQFEMSRSNPKYDYLISSFIKCPRDSSKLVYIFDNQGTLSVILKLKNTDSTRLNNLKFYLEKIQKEIN